MKKLRSPLPPLFLPNELIAEILSYLTVKTITQFKCLSKSLKTLISDPTFIQMHLNKSSQNPNFILTPNRKYCMSNLVSLPVLRLLEKKSSKNVTGNTLQGLKKEICYVVGSCNGLICLVFKFKFLLKSYNKYWFCLWNPATRTMSQKLGFFREYNVLSSEYKFSFGFDYLDGTYKVLSFRVERVVVGNEESWRYEVKILNLGDNCWTNIDNFPLVPLCWNDGVHLSGTVNWLALRSDFESFYVGDVLKVSIANVDEFVIVSLDLSTETYTQFLLPSSFNEVPRVEPSLRVLLDCLCFSHDFKGTELVIWQMKEFGVRESWTQLIRIEYSNLRMKILPINYDLDLVGSMECDAPLLPLYVSKNEDTLILANDEDDKVIIYNQRDERVERTKISNKICWFSAIDYVESLVATPWMIGDEDQLSDNDLGVYGWGNWLSEDEDHLSDNDLGVDGLDNLLSEDEDQFNDIDFGVGGLDDLLSEDEDQLNDIDHGVDGLDDLLSEDEDQLSNIGHGVDE